MDIVSFHTKMTYRTTGFGINASSYQAVQATIASGYVLMIFVNKGIVDVFL